MILDRGIVRVRVRVRVRVTARDRIRVRISIRVMTDLAEVADLLCEPGEG